MWSFWEKALEIPARLGTPLQLVAYTICLLCVLCVVILMLKKPDVPRNVLVVILCVVALVLAVLFASTWLAGREIYRIRVVVYGTNGEMTDLAEVTSSVGVQPKKAINTWEFDLPPQIKPSDGVVTFSASVHDAYLSGSSSLLLGPDHYPTVEVRLAALPQVPIRGTVIDESGRSVNGARVSVSGYSDFAMTDQMGNFALPSHHAEGQMLSIRAEKGDLVADRSAIAGKDVELVLRRYHS